MAAERAEILFGCYRKGEANDPDTYCAAVAAILSRYSEEVVVYVTDPRTGIPGDLKWLPAVAEVKDACINRQSYLDRIEDFARRFNRAPVPVLPASDEKLPGRRATVRIHRDAPQYGPILEWTKTADVADWKFDASGELWVSHVALSP